MIMQDNDLRDLTVDLTMIDWPMQSMQQCWHRTKTATHRRRVWEFNSKNT